MSERDGRPGVPPLKPSEGSEKGTTSSRESKYRAHEARQAISSTGASQVGPLALQPSAARDQSVPGSSAVQAAPLTSSNFARSGALEGPKSGLAEQGVSVPVPQQPSLWPSGAAARSVSPPPSTIQTPTNFDISVRRPRPQNPTLPTGRTSASSDSLMHNLTVGRLQPSRALLAEAQKLHPCSPGATSGLSGPQSSKAGRLGVVQPETRPSLPPRRTAPARQENPAAQDSPASWARPAPQEEAGPSLGAGKPRETNYNPTKGALPNLTPKQHRLESKTESGVSEASDRGAASVDGEQAYSSAIAPITASHAHEPSQTQQRTAAKRTVAGANKPRSIPFRVSTSLPSASALSEDPQIIILATIFFQPNPSTPLSFEPLLTKPPTTTARLRASSRNQRSRRYIATREAQKTIRQQNSRISPRTNQ